MKATNKFKKMFVCMTTVLLLGVSCSDQFLEVLPTGSLADAQVSTKDGIEGLLIGTYAAVNGVFGNRFEGPNHWITGSIMGGDANKGTDAGDYSSINPIQRYAIDPTNGDINNLWRGRFEGVSRANSVLRALSASTTVSPGDAARIGGEARFLRGHFYFDLKKHFNNIPVFDETVLAAEIPLVPNNGDAWAQIEADFQFAYDNLPATTDAGRNNKWAAAAYMGKAKLFQKKYAEAKTWFDDVIANGVTPNGLKYALLDDYASIYNAENDQNAEAVFDVESANNSGSTQNANYFDDLNYPYNTGPDGPGNCCGFFQPSLELGNSFRTVGGLPLLDKSYNLPANAVKNNFILAPGETEETFTEDAGPLDPRIDFSMGRKGIQYLDWIEYPGQAWIRSFAYAGPYSPKKYVYRKSQENSFTDGSSWTRGYAIMNYTVIRYADVLLMAAEAEIEVGTLAKALEYVNLVRARAANPAYWVKNATTGLDEANYNIAQYPSFPDKDFATTAVRFERKLELSGEGHRFFDLVRWGVAATDLNAYLAYESQYLVTKFGGASFTAGKNEYYPIPQTQIDIQGSDVLQQNPGY